MVVAKKRLLADPKGIQPTKISSIVVFALGLALSSGCRAKECIDTAICCSTCSAPPKKKSTCSCDPGEVPISSCPQRSRCVVDYYVGEGPAACCTSTCEDTRIYFAENKRCNGNDPYLHQCAFETACYQSHRANSIGSEFQPWIVEQSGSESALTGLGGSNDRVWAVGLHGRVLERSEGTWQRVPVPTTENLTDVWVDSRGDVWVVGAVGTILRRKANNWEPIDSAVTVQLNAVWGSADGQIWIAGSQGTVLHYDGNALTQQSVPTTADLHSIAGHSGEDLWIVGGEGTALRFNNDSWDKHDVNSDDVLLSATIGPLGDVYAVGFLGHAYRFENGRWSQFLPAISARLTSIVAFNGRLFSFGSGGTIIVATNERWQLVTYVSRFALPDFLAAWTDTTGIWCAGSEGTVLYLPK